MIDTSAIAWPCSRAAEGLALLARSARLPCRSNPPTPASDAGVDEEVLIASSAAALGLEAEAIDASFGEIENLLRSAGPAVLRINTGPETADSPRRADALVLLIGRRGRRLRIVRPDHRLATISLSALRQAIVDPAAAPLITEAERLVEEVGARPSRRSVVARALVDERLRTRRFRAGWLVRTPAGRSFAAQLSGIGAWRQLILLACAHTAQYGLWIGAWWLLGRAALQGHIDASWLLAWMLALVSLVPLQLAALWLQGRVAISVGALLKQRLLAGAFALEPEEIRREGAGHLLGRVIEAEAVESLALGGGLMALLAALELMVGTCILAIAAPLVAVLLLVWAVIAGVLALWFFRRRFQWVRLRLDLTFDLIERMIGHRTRAAQQSPHEWHRGEDESLERYVHSSAAMDRAAARLIALVPRGWVLLGLCGLTPLFVAGRSPTSLAVGLGGVLLTFRAFQRLTAGVWSLTGAAIAWQQTAPVFHAAARTADQPSSVRPDSEARIPVTLDAADLRFTHQGRSVPALQGCSLTLAAGERVILQGRSGGGKSTLASLLAGLRTPQSGLLLVNGLDRHTLGLDGWRRRVVLVPQFHENHLALGSVAFNVLMGAGWPANEQAFARADSVLRELGLGPTLDRMPSGLLQTIGETGWQLSHGERSRIYLARALLQNPDVLILDESFAQLDPANMHLALGAVLARAKTVLLIAHP
jgi:ATP-binding cassette subfamily B protein